MDLGFWITVALFLVPAYVANSTAMVFGGKTRLDFGKNFYDGQPVFGSGKTWKGTTIGLALGFFAVIVTYALFYNELPSFLFNENYLLYGFLVALGAIVGDIVGSFLKRRFLVKQGSPALILDQLDFIVGAYVFTLPLMVPTAQEVVVVAVFTVATHVASNYIAFKLGVKKVPW